ncbi:MAG: BatA domain-containing protein [Phycisphaerae bacterium]|nr:BatA domain-containing protein [Phycisphaerae bacterium]
MTFLTPLMLLGLAAAGIPLLLHLLSRVRAKEEPFPTLRFLRQCMEKTARRRRIENWLLLLLRCGVLAVPALALAEPISKAADWFGGGQDAAVLLVDNSYSMAVGRGEQTRLGRAKSAAARVLSDRDAPADVLSTQRAGRWRNVDAVGIEYGANRLAERFARAVEWSADSSNPRRSIYYFGDLQRRSLQPLLESDVLSDAREMKLLFLDAARGEINNVGITNVSIVGPRVADATVTFRVTIVNTSPSARRVDVTFRPDDAKAAPRKITQSLGPAGRDDAEATLTFTHRVSQPGWSLGEIRIEQADDLLVDNRWRYCLDVAPHVRALVVHGPSQADPGEMLSLALDWRDETQADRPWPIRVTNIAAEEFTAGILNSFQAVFFRDVPTFTKQTAAALGEFVRNGGTVWFFLGPEVNLADYNARFSETSAGLLPGVLGEPFGQVGPDADVLAVKDVAEDHPLFAGLFDAPADYRTTRTRRYVSFQARSGAARILMTLENDAPLLVEQTVGKGKTLWCFTTADPRWGNLPAQPIFLPMVVRAATRSVETRAGSAMHTAGREIEIQPGPRAADATNLRITPPGGVENTQPLTIPLEKGSARFTRTDRLGVYSWEALDGNQKVLAGGAFVVNPYGPESDLVAFTPEALRTELRNRGCKQAYVAATLDELSAAVAADAQGRNYRDVLVAAVILLLLAEAVAANRRKVVVGSQ